MGRWEDAQCLLNNNVGADGNPPMGRLPSSPTEPEKKIFTVTEANRLVKNEFSKIPSFQNIAITGEISNYKPHYSGHHYITLKDENASIDCIWFKWQASGLNFNIENGLKVIAYGKLDVYEKGGRYNLHIENLEPEGIGSLAIAYEQLKKKLEEKGYFREEHKKEIPRFPNKIGVVTSPTGAVWHDIQNVATRRYPNAEIILYPAKVQGEGGELEVAAGIEYFNTRDDIDTLIIGRGGGSMEDLWNFNEEIVAYAIYNSKIPIISSVGHETDFTIADFVADVRAPTPSAAAELATPDMLELKNIIKTNYLRMLKALRNNIASKREILKRIVVKNPKDIIQNYYLMLDYTYEKLVNIVKTNLSKKRENLKILVGKLDSLSPLSVISRGYSVATVNGATIRDIKQVKLGDKMETMVNGGKILSKIENVFTEKNC